MSHKWEKNKSKLCFVKSSFRQKVWSRFPITQCLIVSPFQWRSPCLLLNDRGVTIQNFFHDTYCDILDKWRYVSWYVLWHFVYLWFFWREIQNVSISLTWNSTAAVQGQHRLCVSPFFFLKDLPHTSVKIKSNIWEKKNTQYLCS